MSKEHLKPFKKGESGNPKGRPKKMVTLLKAQGYRVSEINDTIQVMMSMDVNELKKVFNDPKATILERTIANSLGKSMSKGDLSSIETLLNRAFGRPKEQSEVDLKSDNIIQVKFVPFNGHSFTTPTSGTD